MSAPAIRVEHLSKRYVRGAAAGAGGGLLSEQLVRAAGALTRAGRERRAATTEPFWALRDISMEVAPGEVVGLIGPNGAGKSTLLKLLARITLPTEGRIELRGRTASLLEVGTGFHPELTGRENVALNGAILGLSRQEIARRFDAIVEFSGVEKFIDTPVKRYSSGMTVRLGFAVAAHLEAEIMLIDEVLAVGDAAFQRKCMSKIRELTDEGGRTIVFVSHNLSWVERLCDRVFLIQDGVVAGEGPVSQVIAGYLTSVDPIQHGGSTQIPDTAPRIGSGSSKFRSARLLGSDGGGATGSLLLNEPLVIEAELEVMETIEEAVLEVGITTGDGLRIITSMSTDGGRPPVRLEPGRHGLRAELEPELLPGEFVLDIGVHELADATVSTVDLVERVLQFDVGASDGDEETYAWGVRGYLRADTRWELQRAPATGRLDG
jgi:ABC-type polysaccharide/polyol phosphate transport system ATPase subunit